MKRRLLFFLALIMILCNSPVNAQFQVNTATMTDNKVITYTPQYLASEYEFFSSGYFLSFQIIEGQYYILAEFQAWNITNLEPSKIINTTFIFRDGYELVIPTTSYFNKTITAVAEYNSYWTNYSVRSIITKEQLDLFTKKQLLSMANNFNGESRIFDAYIPQKKSIYIAKSASYFLNGEKVNEKVLTKRFAQNKSKELYNNNKWDF